jgi:hypothetical protein
LPNAANGGRMAPMIESPMIEPPMIEPTGEGT